MKNTSMAVNIKTHLGHVASTCMRMLKARTDHCSLKRRACKWLFGYVQDNPPRLLYKYAPVATDVLQCGEILFAGKIITPIF